ncbi:MAG TPA: hypothetical protein VMY77_15700 [Chitinophagaceae bacterium]|nr:hypothetical protein [Chitinophagaceae bacterium]
MQKFDITLKNEKEKTYRFIILLFVILHFLFFVYLLFDEQLWKKGVGGLVVTALYSAYRLLITNTRHEKFSLGPGYFFVFAFIVIDDSWLLWGIELILSILSGVALIPVAFKFTSTDIQRIVYPSKKYQWDEFSNVMLKDNILTLDFKNNKLLQAEIVNKNINEDAFNTFAKEQLNKT